MYSIVNNNSKQKKNRLLTYRPAKPARHSLKTRYTRYFATKVARDPPGDGTADRVANQIRKGFAGEPLQGLALECFGS